MSTDLRDVMKHLGERLTDPEVDDMLKEADRENKGRVHYQGFEILPFFVYHHLFGLSFGLGFRYFLKFFAFFVYRLNFKSSQRHR